MRSCNTLTQRCVPAPTCCSTSCVITGEGHADRQTLMGKLPVRAMLRAKAKGVPTWLLAGRTDDRDELLKAGFARVESITPDGMELAEAVKKDVALANLRSAVVELIKSNQGC